MYAIIEKTSKTIQKKKKTICANTWLQLKNSRVICRQQESTNKVSFFICFTTGVNNTRSVQVSGVISGEWQQRLSIFGIWSFYIDVLKRELRENVSKFWLKKIQRDKKSRPRARIKQKKVALKITKTNRALFWCFN